MPFAPLATCASLEAVCLLCVFLALFFLCFEPILPTPPLSRGMLDLFDSLILSAPVGYLLLRCFLL